MKIPTSFDYHGCGHGWIEFLPNGTPVKMRYAETIQDEGTTKQNVSIDKDAKHVDPWVTSNGNIRLWGNFSCWSFCPY